MNGILNCWRCVFPLRCAFRLLRQQERWAVALLLPPWDKAQYLCEGEEGAEIQSGILVWFSHGMNELLGEGEWCGSLQALKYMLVGEVKRYGSSWLTCTKKTAILSHVLRLRAGATKHPSEDALWAWHEICWIQSKDTYCCQRMLKQVLTVFLLLTSIFNILSSIHVTIGKYVLRLRTSYAGHAPQAWQKCQLDL